MKGLLDRLRQRRQAVSLVVLAAAWLPAVHVWWIAPQRAALAQRRDALVQTQAEIARSRQAAAQLPAAEAGVAALAARLDAEYATRREVGDTAFMLRRIESLASGADIEIRGFTPQPAVVHELYSEWPLRLELGGDYGGLLRFFEQLGRCMPAVLVGEFAFEGVDAPTAGATVAAAATVTAVGFHGATGRAAASGASADCRPAAGDAAVDGAGAPADPFARRPPAADAAPAAARAPGLPGLRVGELDLQGLVRSASGPLAVVAAPDGRTYLLRGGERLLDGAVEAVHADAVVFLEDGSGAARETRMSLADSTSGR